MGFLLFVLRLFFRVFSFTGSCTRDTLLVAVGTDGMVGVLVVLIVLVLVLFVAVGGGG